MIIIFMIFMSIVMEMDMIMISTKLLLAILLKAVNHSRDSKGPSANNNSVRIAKTMVVMMPL